MKQTKNLSEGLAYVSPSVKVKNLRARRAVMTLSNDYGEEYKAGNDVLWGNQVDF